MLFGDLKRAIEDTILKPETNRLSDIGKRTTLAALDLVQVNHNHSGSTANLQNEAYLESVGALNYCSQEPASSLAESGYTTTSSTTSENTTHTAQSFSSSNSLDTVVLRQSISCRPSLGASRRSSRVFPHYCQTKRKRSNSVSSCLNKNRHTRQGTSSTAAGVSCTSAGGASALSLPPTARQTPFRFGEFDEKLYPDLPKNENLPILRMFSQGKSSSTDEYCLARTNDLSNSEDIRPISEWSCARCKENNARHDKVVGGQNIRKNTTDSVLRNVKLINAETSKESTAALFARFRSKRSYDSDCDEEMECD
uniref:UDENN domain-containing protein n=1 Tax=Syphacia muris TaxID=451379 RepID=A0A0N5ATN7_9BILA